MTSTLLPSRLAHLLSASCLLVLTACSNDSPQSPGQVSDAAKEPDTRPNIVYIMADDLGYSDLSAYGSEIPTPNLDDLAQGGMMLTEFYTSMTCSPTRSMFISGTDNHLAGLGVMTGPIRDEHMDEPGYLGYLNFEVASLPQLLSDAGYDTYMTGKWHLGNEVETGPVARGFKHAFATLDGGSHLGGLDWSAPIPAEYRDDEELIHIEDDDFYSTEAFTERMIDYIKRDRDAGKPFFAWLAYTAPHWPLQAPQDSIERFSGWYDEGYEVIYQRRFARMRELDMLAENAQPVDDDVWQPRWDELSDEEQRFAARRMEIYAAMVSDLDHYVGEFVDYLKSIDEFDNTLIVVTSDNGAEGGRRDLILPISDYIGNGFDNSFDNLGKADSYVMYGPNWATVSSGAHRRHKFTAFEGGIHSPAFAHFPDMIAPGTRSGAVSTVMDLLPTFLSLAEASVPGREYQGREIHPPKGRSLLAVLSGEAEAVHPQDHMLGWELFGHRGIRQGDWKIVWDADQGDAAHWQLFNIAQDPSETTNLADSNPDKLAEMTSLWTRYEQENNVIY